MPPPSTLVIVALAALLVLFQLLKKRTAARQLVKGKWRLIDLPLVVSPHSLDLPTIDGFLPMNASIVQGKGETWLLVRYVNYVLHRNSKRDQKGPGRSEYALARLDDRLAQPVESKRVQIDTPIHEPPGRISYGLEDCRVDTSADDLSQCRIIGTTCSYNSRNTNDAIMATLDIPKGMISNLVVLPSPSGKLEKNWIPVNLGAAQEIIYGYSPLRTYDIGSRQVATVDAFKDTCPVYGSSNWTKVGEEWIALVHTSYLVRQEKYYFHKLIVFSGQKRMLKQTDWFTFEGQLVEFSYGILSVERNLHIWYSVFDRNPRHVVVSIDALPWLA